MADPEFRNGMKAAQSAMLDARYASLFSSLKLTPAQLDQFKQLLIEKQQELTDAVAAAQQQGLTPFRNRAQWLDSINNALAGINSEISAAIGPDQFAQYQFYERTGPQRATALLLERSLSYTGEPLSPVQQQKLVESLATTAEKDYTVLEGIGTGFGAGQGVGALHGAGLASSPPVVDPISAQAIAAARTFLSPGQVAQLEALQRSIQLQFQLQRAARAAPGDTAAASTAPH
jgi:hypothetical protein